MAKQKQNEPTLAEIKLLILDLRESMRKENAELYAIKLIEKLVFGMIGFILIAVLGAIIAGVIK